mgnify:CR=1 FL=1
MALLAATNTDVPEKSLYDVTAWFDTLLFTITYSLLSTVFAAGNVILTLPAAGPIIKVWSSTSKVVETVVTLMALPKLPTTSNLLVGGPDG